MKDKKLIISIITSLLIFGGMVVFKFQQRQNEADFINRLKVDNVIELECSIKKVSLEQYYHSSYILINCGDHITRIDFAGQRFAYNVELETENKVKLSYYENVGCLKSLESASGLKHDFIIRSENTCIRY